MMMDSIQFIQKMYHNYNNRQYKAYAEICDRQNVNVEFQFLQTNFSDSKKKDQDYNVKIPRQS